MTQSETKTRRKRSDETVVNGDCFEVITQLPDDSFHAVVTDPPYNFEGGFMQEEWDEIGSPDDYQAWCKAWSSDLLRVLKPGGHLIAFSGNRSHHRLMAGVEDAGYEIRDTITWHYGQGFPKGARLKTYLDDEEAEEWGDWRGTLKPATEFAVLARTPLDGSSATQNQVEHGTGNLNVEACRIPLNPTVDESQRRTMTRSNKDRDDGWEMDESGEHDTEVIDEEGRYPANLVLDSTMAEVMDLGYETSTTGNRSSESQDAVVENTQWYVDNHQSDEYTDSGGLSRFFYCPKAHKNERTHDGDIENDHPTVKPIDLMEWLVKLVTAEGQWVLDPFVGSGTTLLAAQNTGRRAMGIEQDEAYCEIARGRLEVNATDQSEDDDTEE